MGDDLRRGEVTGNDAFSWGAMAIGVPQPSSAVSIQLPEPVIIRLLRNPSPYAKLPVT